MEVVGLFIRKRDLKTEQKKKQIISKQTFISKLAEKGNLN